MISGNAFIFKDRKVGIFIEEMKTLNGKKYIISDTLKKYNWKLRCTKKEILGYEVQKAVKTDTITSITQIGTEYKESKKAQTTIAWYTPKLPFTDGPEYFNELPSLILEIE